MTPKEQWEKYGPKDIVSPIQEFHEKGRAVASQSLIRAIIFGIGCIAFGIKAIWELYHGAHMTGVIDSSENIYDTLYMKEEAR